LLDLAPTTAQEDAILTFLGQRTELRVLDLHLWSIGRGKMSCIMTLEVRDGFDLMKLRSDVLAQFRLAHLTIEPRVTRPG
jgi:Co/Zn/Cd efflux system component